MSPEIPNSYNLDNSTTYNINPNNDINILHFELKSIYFKTFERYKIWLENKFCSNYSRDMYNSLDKIFNIHKCITLKDVYNNIENNLLNERSSRTTLRVWFNFLEEKEIINDTLLQKLRNKVKLNIKVQIDKYIPNDTEINNLLENMQNYNILDYVVVRMFLDSGLRITEVQYLLQNYTNKNIEINGNIVTIALYYLRGSKNSYYMFLSKDTFNLFTQNLEQLKTYNIEKLKTHIKRNNLTPLKYLRKYHFTKMIKSGISLEIANFIQGRVSQNIGFNHYLAKKELAVKEYRKLLD